MNVVKKIRLRNPYVLGYDINYYYEICHNHDFYEALIVLSGNAIHCVNDRIQFLEKGDIVFIRPNDAHFLSPSNKARERYEFFNLHITEDYMKTQYSYSKELKEKIEEPILPPIVHLGTREFIFLSSKLKNLNSMIFGEKRNFFYHTIMKEIIWHFLADEVSVTATAVPEWFSEFLMEIARPENFTLNYDEIIKLAGVTEGTLWRNFKKYINLTPTEYINNLKIDYAYELVIGSRHDFGEIASMAGYNNYPYFYKKFLEKFGVSPKEIRNKQP